MLPWIVLLLSSFTSLLVAVCWLSPCVFSMNFVVDNLLLSLQMRSLKCELFLNLGGKNYQNEYRGNIYFIPINMFGGEPESTGTSIKH